MSDNSNDKYSAVRKITQWKEVEKSDVPEKDLCCICLYEFHDEEEDNDDKIVQLSRCGPHYYHRDCILQCYNPPKASDKLDHDGHLTCPVCSIIYGIRTGAMPKGTMSVTRINRPLPSYSGKTIQIVYSFPSGTQGPEHPSPGSYYTGTSRTCYLPDTDEGNEVLRKLQVAFDRRLSFMIGTSVTTGTSNTVVWNGIHHKTNFNGGAAGFGYPDETYLNRVTQELACVGIL